MKTRLAFAFALCASALLGGQERLVQIDLARKNQNALSFVWTEYQNTAIRASVKDNGVDFNLDGWDAFLVLGGNARGLVVDGVRDGYGDFVFHVDQSAMPTNGKYTVQITAQRGYHTEEWASGVVRVQLNPGVEYLPTCWMGYERVAKLAALFISTNDVRKAVDEIMGDDFNLDCVTKTNAAIIVKKSRTSDIPKGARFALYEPNDLGKTYKNVSYPNIIIMGGPEVSNLVFEVASTGAIYSPTNIGGNVWHYRDYSAGDFVMISEIFVTDSERSQMIGDAGGVR